MLKPVSSSSKVPALRKLLNTELNRRGIAWESQSSYAAILSEVLLKVIPADIVVDYCKKESTEIATGNSQASSEELEKLFTFH